MAQHIPTRAFKQKAFRAIENGIHSAFNRSYDMKTSMRYEYVGVQDGREVYLTTRNIPEGVVCGTNKGTFEIHFEPETQTIEELYLVA